MEIYETMTFKHHYNTYYNIVLQVTGIHAIRIITLSKLELFAG